MKATLLRRFSGQFYQNIFEVNFDDQPDLKRLFEPNLEPERIIRNISFELDVKIESHKALLFFDEIQ